MSSDPQLQDRKASQYLDDGRWGVLSADNSIIVRLRENKTEQECREIANAHNESLRLAILVRRP